MVYDKLTEPLGCLAACLVDALWRRRSAGKSGKLEHLEVEAALPQSVRARLQEPIRADRHSTGLPVFDPIYLETYTG